MCSSRDIQCYVEEFSLKHLTTGDILVKAFEKNLITEQQGNELWSKMLAKRRKLGAVSFTEFLLKNKQEKSFGFEKESF